MYVYLITNSINGKKYVGKTKSTIEKRFKRHCYLSKFKSTYLYNAMQKYGVHNFTVTSLEKVEDVTQLSLKEIFWISELRPEYNMTSGGDGGDTSSSEKYKKYMAVRSMLISGCNNPFFGKKHTEETKRKISEKKLGSKHTQETKEILRHKNLGKKMSAESISKTKLANSKTWFLIDPNGNPIEVHNLSEFCSKNNLDQRNMCNMYNGRYKSSKKYKRDYDKHPIEDKLCAQ